MENNQLKSMKKTGTLFGVEIRQEKSSQMLSLSDLKEAYARARVINNWTEKNINSILSGKDNIEKIFFILKEEDKTQDSYKDFCKKVEKSSLVKVLKNLNVYRTYGKGESKNTFCEFNIWMLVCMELNPMLYAQGMSIYFGDREMFRLKTVNTEEIYTALNHENAWRHFYPEGNGKAKKGYHLHHINPRWRHENIKRYNQWNIEDLQMMTAEEHIKLHKKIGDWRDFQERRILDRIETDNLSNALLKTILNYNETDYKAIVSAFNYILSETRKIKPLYPANKKEQEILFNFEDNIAFVINNNYVKSISEILNLIKEAGKKYILDAV